MFQIEEHNLIQDCPTQWGSTLAMLQHVSEQQAAIATILIEGKLQYLMPEGEEWTGSAKSRNGMERNGTN